MPEHMHSLSESGNHKIKYTNKLMLKIENYTFKIITLKNNNILKIVKSATI